MKYFAVLVDDANGNPRQMWEDGEAHTLREWREILTNQGIRVWNMTPCMKGLINESTNDQRSISTAA